MTSASSALLTATAVAVAFNAYIAGRSTRQAVAWASAAVITGFCGLLFLLVTQLSHQYVSDLLLAVTLGTFAAGELVAVRAAYEARTTQLGRWLLVSTAWPFVLLITLHVGHLLKSLTSGIAL